LRRARALLSPDIESFTTGRRQMEMQAKAYGRGVIVAGLAVSAVITLITFLPPGYGGKGFVLFSWHPALMAFAFLGFMGSGMLAYIAPIEEKKQSRNLHRAMQMTAGVLAVLGLAAIMLNKVRIGKSVWPKTTHAWFGFFALLGTAIQAYSGMTKYAQARQRGYSGFKWHGDLGRVVYALGIVTIALGLVAIFSGLKLWICMILSQGVGVMVILVSYRRYPGMSLLPGSEGTPASNSNI